MIVDLGPYQILVLKRGDSLGKKASALPDVSHHSRALCFPIPHAVLTSSGSAEREPRARRCTCPWEGERFLDAEDVNVLLPWEFKCGDVAGLPTLTQQT